MSARAFIATNLDSSPLQWLTTLPILFRINPRVGRNTMTSSSDFWQICSRLMNQDLQGYSEYNSYTTGLRFLVFHGSIYCSISEY